MTETPCFAELVENMEKIASRMTEALRRDFCAKLASLPVEARARFRERLIALYALKVSRRTIDALCATVVSYPGLLADAEALNFVDSGAAVEPLLEVAGNMRRSFLSLQTAWEHLKDWRDFVGESTDGFTTEWQLLSHFGTLGLPIEVKRPIGNDSSPYDIEVTRVCATPADTASIVTALQAKSAIVPPEGGVAVEDLLILVDPDAPRATRLAFSSKLILERYASLVHCRELHMSTGLDMHLALHAHALFNVLQPPPRGVRKEDLEAHMRRQYLGRAYQCAKCSFGPIDHFACGDLAAHNGQRVGHAVINNACPRCAWFSKFLSDWPKWDGTLPDEAALSCERPEGDAVQITAASAEIALRICYSARAIWDSSDSGQAHQLVHKLGDWETLTSVDGVQHPVQLLLALVVADTVPEDIFGPVPMAQLLNEVCARRAADELRRNGAAVAQRRVGAFLGVSYFSAPKLIRGVPLENQFELAREACSRDYVIDPDAYDFKSWVRGALAPWADAITFARRLRAVVHARDGSWRRLARDMEAGPAAYSDVIQELQRPPGKNDTVAALLGVRRKEDAQRVLATVAAQAFLHASPQSRRTRDVGGDLDEPLGDVREEGTLAGLCVELRLLYFLPKLADAQKAADEAGRKLEAAGHTHGLSKHEFWRLWEAAYDGENSLRFLSMSNAAFVDRHADRR